MTTTPPTSPAHDDAPARRAGPAEPGRRPAKPRPSPAARRAGYVVAIALNLALLGVIHAWPGWRELSFLTEETTRVLPWVTAQLGVAIAWNLLWLVRDPRWSRALGDVVTSALGVVVTAQILTVFPFAFDDDGASWETVARVVLWVGLVGSAIGVVANLALLVQAARRRD